MGRALRPIVLGGYVGLLLTLLGAELGEIAWMVGGIFATVARRLRRLRLLGCAAVRDGGDLAHAARRRLGRRRARRAAAAAGHPRGRPAACIFTVLIAVFADDTAAYFVGRTIGRHKMAPTISPGKSWEGFVGGTLAAIAVAVLRAVRPGLPHDPGGRSRSVPPSRSPRRSATCSSRRSSATSA